MLPPGSTAGHNRIILSGIIISFFIIGLAVFIANSRISFFGRASSQSGIRSGGVLSLDNSYLFASPISALADGSSVIRVTAIILSNQGLGITNQPVSLKITANGVSIKPIQPVTDNFGRTTFDLTSSAPGNYTISAEVSGSSLPATVSIVFR